MWQIYGKAEDGCMLDIGSSLSKVAESMDDLKVELAWYDKNADCIQYKTIMPQNKYSLFLIDILYTSKNDDGTYTVKRSDERIEKVPEEVIADISVYCKDMCWCFENECRLILRVNKSTINSNKYNTAIITLPDSVRKKITNIEKIVKNPFYSSPLAVACRPSMLSGNIDFSQ